MMETVAYKTPYFETGRNGKLIPIYADAKGTEADIKHGWEPLVRLSDAEARIKELEAANAFTLSDSSRMLQKSDVQGACPHPDDCFYFGDRVRCGPCAVKASAANGVEIDDTHSHLPEVCRLRRELKAAEARAEAAEAMLMEAKTALEPFAAVGAELDKSSKPDDHNAWGFNSGMTTYGDFRAARAIADKIGGKDE